MGAQEEQTETSTSKESNQIREAKERLDAAVQTLKASCEAAPGQCGEPQTRNQLKDGMQDVVNSYQSCTGEKRIDKIYDSVVESVIKRAKEGAGSQVAKGNEDVVL